MLGMLTMIMHGTDSGGIHVPGITSIDIYTSPLRGDTHNGMREQVITH